MNKSRQYIFINSTLAFITAFFITTLIHEFGHFLSYLLFGAHPVLYHNYVQTPDQIDLTTKVVSALAGPVISLVQGIIFGIIVFRRKKNKAIDLLFLWLSLLGFVNFFGYLMLTPLSTAGDTGKVAELLRLNYIVRILIAAGGLATVITIVVKIGKKFANFFPHINKIEERRKYVYSIMFYPILAGSVVNTLFAFPVPAVISIIYPATSSFVIMSSFGAILKSDSPLSYESGIGVRISRKLVILLVILFIINRLLTFGLG